MRVLGVRVLGLPLLDYLALEDLAATCHAMGPLDLLVRYRPAAAVGRYRLAGRSGRRVLTCSDQVTAGDQDRHTRQGVVVVGGRAAVTVAREPRAE